MGTKSGYQMCPFYEVDSLTLSDFRRGRAIDVDDVD